MNMNKKRVLEGWSHAHNRLKLPYLPPEIKAGYQRAKEHAEAALEILRRLETEL